MDMPPGLFYPFYPEASVSHEVLQGNRPGAANSQDGPSHSGPDYSHLLAAAAAAQEGSYQPTSQNTFMSEERTPPPQHGTAWMGSVSLVLFCSLISHA
jgi:hypothetical protein